MENNVVSPANLESGSFFFSNVVVKTNNTGIINMLATYSEVYAIQFYIINAPLGMDTQPEYDYKDAIVILTPKHKICFVNLVSENHESFDDYVEDFLEDLGHQSEKYEYRKYLGRPRVWRNRLVVTMDVAQIRNVDDILSYSQLSDEAEQRNADFLISLLIGSINNIARIGGEQPTTILDKVKKKIILFDGDQSRFIYTQPANKKRIYIQGLAGTGKTELLLHKLKDLYLKDDSSRIVFTCYNRTLAKNMEKRVPEFFNFLRVQEQIKWNERLWVMRSWGYRGIADSGVYSFLCVYYDLIYHPYTPNYNFDDVCKTAIESLKGIMALGKFEPCFDYMLIDESQDFPPSFFDLCEMVTRHTVYIAGDIFQDIYARTIDKNVKSDFLLNKCYRTDPKTLMFAHAVGMGLYDRPVIRWLEDEEWKICGYEIRRAENTVTFTRQPLRRFEDLEDNSIDNIGLYSCAGGQDMVNGIFQIIDHIKEIHPTVHAGDIAIVFMEGDNKFNYALADYLTIQISAIYGWNVVKGYETKDSTTDSVFISNRNNIKGLEFPFVICFAHGKISENVFYRNTLYMMLTRSFITSYFLINNKNDKNKQFIDIYTKAAKDICLTGKMVLREPSVEEKRLQNQKVSFAITQKQRPAKEIIEEVLKGNPGLSVKNQTRVMQAMLQYIREEGTLEEDEIKERTQKLIKVYL